MVTANLLEKEKSIEQLELWAQVLEDENPPHPTWFTGSERPACCVTLPNCTSAFWLVHAFGVGIGPMTTVLSIAAIFVAWLFLIP